MAIYADCKSKRKARKKWRQSEKGKAWDKTYAQRDYVKAKKHEYYIQNKIRWYVEKPQWGGKREEKTSYPAHEEWAKENGYRDNDHLHGTNSKKFIDDALNTKNTVGFKDET